MDFFVVILFAALFLFCWLAWLLSWTCICVFCFYCLFVVVGSAILQCATDAIGLGLKALIALKSADFPLP